MQNTKYKIQNIEYKIQNTKYKIQNTTCNTKVGSSSGGNCETSEYASEVSEDYNSVDGSTSEARWEDILRDFFGG